MTPQQTHPLPIIQSNPHAGLGVPPEIQEMLQISPRDLYNDADLWADIHFDFSAPGLDPAAPGGNGRGVLANVTMPIARALIDVNRSADDFDNPDGPIKTATSYGRAIYNTPPDLELRATLMTRYYAPFHAGLQRAMDEHGAEMQLFLDCHNMAQHSPSAYAYAGAARPFICLANFGDEQGEPRPDLGYTSCPPAFLRAGAEIAARLFADLELLEPDAAPAPVVKMNWPFHGGMILRNYWAGAYDPSAAAADAATRAPGIMIEINRGLFVGDQTADTPEAPPDLARLAEVRSRLYQWTVEMVALLA
ncbi:MAG: N-formylglutamate amidohydrolase [Caldilineaceae bacterium]|nr:N-formylglutamate amidohydrolase [Caldilineaceae bacterium]